LFIQLPLFVFLLPIFPRYYREFQHYFEKCWFFIPVYMMEYLFGMKIFVSGDPFPRDDRVLIFANHRSRLDWMFCWSFVFHVGSIKHLKIVLKDTLKYIPGFGWAMQLFLFLFLSRKWEKDQIYLEKQYTFFAQNKLPLQLLIFPEGTDLSPENQQRHREYSQSKNLTVYQYLLHPRIKGTYYTLSLLKDSLDAVYDMTIGYPEHMPRGEKDILLGIFPQQVHFHIRRYLISDIPLNTEKEFGIWLQQRWDEKEKLLTQFYKTKSFSPDSICIERVSLYKSLHYFIFWAFFLYFFWYWILTYWFTKWYLLGAVLIWAGLTKLGGVEVFEAEMGLRRLAASAVKEKVS